MHCSLPADGTGQLRHPWHGVEGRMLRSLLRRKPFTQRRSRRTCLVLAAGIQKLPIFPLGIVAFPTAQVPLTIFEARYRVLFSTLLAGAEGIDEALVQEESEFRASRQFGMAYVNPRGGVADVGTILRIEGHSTLDDGRLIVNTLGTKRFRILKVLEKRPVIIAQCEILDELDDENSPEAQQLMEDASEKFCALCQLSQKLRKQKGDGLLPELAQLGQLGPSAFSYWIASFFGDAQAVQQLLLQEDSLITRLTSLSEILDKYVSYLRAAVALDSLSASSPATDSGEQSGDQQQKPSADDDTSQQQP